MPRAPSGTRSVGTKGVGRNGSLNRLMQKIQTRELVADEPAVIDDWQATEVSFTTVRPLRDHDPRRARPRRIDARRRRQDGRTPELEGQRPPGHGPSLHARPGQYQAAPTALRRPERLPGR